MADSETSAMNVPEGVEPAEEVFPTPEKVKKKKKLTKAEKKRLKSDEELKRQEEEEMQRIQEELERQEQERIAQEKANKKELEEKIISNCENDLMIKVVVLTEIKNLLLEFHSTRRRLAKWEHFMKCDHMPDPTNLREVNTFITLWREDVNSNHISTVLRDSNKLLQLIDQLKFELEDTPLQDLTLTLQQTYQNTIIDLQDALLFKLNKASYLLLLDASALADSDTMNLQVVNGNETITICLWGNVGKNPRYKAYEFSDQHFKFVLPKRLLVMDIAIRGLITKFDHLSPLCKTYNPWIRLKSLQLDTVEIILPDLPQLSAPEPEKVALETRIIPSPVSDDFSETSKKKNGSRRVSLAQIKKKKKDNIGVVTPLGAKVGEVDKAFSFPVVLEEIEPERPEINLDEFTTIGGVIYLDLLHLPPQPKVVKNWTIRQIDDVPYLRHLIYSEVDKKPTEGRNLDTPDNTETAHESAEPPHTPAEDKPLEENKEEESDELTTETELSIAKKSALFFTVPIPNDVIFASKPILVRWDADTKTWRKDGFIDVMLDIDTKTASFWTDKFFPVSFVQSKYLHIPYNDWQYLPQALDEGIFNLSTALMKVNIRLKNNVCCLDSCIFKDEECLDHLKQQWMSLSCLLQALNAAGVNLCFHNDTTRALNTKVNHMEKNVYKSIALSSCAVAYQSSIWNAKRDPSIIIQMALKVSDEVLTQDDWKLMHIEERFVNMLTMKESSRIFSDAIEPSVLFHTSLYTMALLEFCDEAAMLQIKSTSSLFIDNIYQLFSAIRVICFTK